MDRPGRNWHINKAVANATSDTPNVQILTITVALYRKRWFFFTETANAVNQYRLWGFSWHTIRGGTHCCYIKKAIISTKRFVPEA